MKQRIIRISIFIFFFLISLLVSSLVLNKGNSDMTVEMSKASLPVVNMRIDGREVNTLFGYTSDMQGKYLRDTLTPMKSDKKMGLRITHNTDKIDGISIEVRSCGMDRLVEKTELMNYVRSDDTITADFNIKDLIEENVEYVLVIKLSIGGSEVSYFTRIIENDGIVADEQLDFVREFHEKALDKTRAGDLAMYLESNEEGDNSTYAHVDIHSSLHQVSWGDLQIDKVGEVNTQVYDMDENLSTIGLSYTLELPGKDKNERYLVNELFRTRYTPERIYLLDYDRTMSRLFDPERGVFANDKVVLGITGEEVSLDENSEGTVVTFEQTGALYEYRNSDGLLARLFSFYDDDNMDERTLNRMHRIKVQNIDENGNVFFIVYGYMNRGRHEGMVGVSAYYYDNARNYIEEKLFIPYSRSAAMLAEDVEKLSYISRNNYFYSYLDKTLYRMDLDGADVSIIAGDLRSDSFMASESNTMAAWMEEDNIELLDLNSNTSRKISPRGDEDLQLIGFLGDDIVYGISDPGDMVRDMSGVVSAPMHTIKIEDKNGYELKSYSKENIYVYNTSIGNMTLHLKRVKKNNETGEYRLIEDDQIMDNKKTDETRNSLMQVVTKNRETVTQIALISNVSESIKLQTPREVLIEGGRTIEPDIHSHEDEYTVYGRGEFIGTSLRPYEAVNTAAAISGVVLNDDQVYIWQKGNRAVRKDLTEYRFSSASEEDGVSSIARCMSVMLDKKVPEEQLQSELDMGDAPVDVLEKHCNGQVIDLSGCELSSVLYYVSEGDPVLAVVPGGGTVLIVGYDEKNTIILDPMETDKYKKGMNDSKEWFAESRNAFITILKHPVSQ